ncbi:PREDICTED: F-box/FBD/LRR-repeat protein At1g51370-like [Camelina sativa]|uniref:F-box/FBD/LRR-repeat protein At1g51370-like n=1 Tax=Camelina sativa TaxID=90675 RepID=A0ABM1R9D6_CAMSA|nr:PREDICTED: F-box/FBD/LRR-repeat protein At1g51370-like [Camelina sativa]
MICNILTDVTDTWRVKDLVISNLIWKGILQYFKSGPVLQFRDLSRLNVKFSKSDLEMLPILLESCPKLESFVLELVKGKYIFREKKDSKVMFSTVPQCLVSLLKFVEWKRAYSLFEGEMELIRYFLKNSTILEKFRLDAYSTEKAKCAFLQELLAMPRCSSICEIHYSFIPRKNIEYFVG